MTLGIIYAATGLGTGFGPLIIRQRIGDDRTSLMRAITVGFLFLTAGVTILGFAPNLGWIIGATLLRGIGSGALWVFSSAILMQLSDNQFRGRVFAFEFAALTLTQSISTLVSGQAMDRWQFEVQEVLLMLGGLAFLMTMIWFMFRQRSSVPSQVVPLPGD